MSIQNKNKKVLSALGNDAKSGRDAEMIMSSLIQNREASLSSGIRHLSLPLRILVFFRGLILPLLLPIYWVSLLLTFLRLRFMKRSEAEVLSPIVFDLLFQHWGKYPYHFFTKAIEAIYFSRETIQSPSLEIGVYTGETSIAVFFGKKIDFGMEFVPQNLARFAEKKQDIYGQHFCGDIYHIPLPNSSLRSVYIVHSLDDIERGLDGALEECWRVLRPGGELAFSLYSHRFLDNNALVRALSLMGFKNSASRLFSTLFPGTHNCYSAEEWRQLLSRWGYQVNEIHYFLPVGFARFIDFPFRLEGVFINLFRFHAFVTPWLRSVWLRETYRRILSDAVSSLYHQCESRNEEGINIFIKASRLADTSDSGIQERPGFACPVCRNLLEPTDAERGPVLRCVSCQQQHPFWKGFPLLLPNSRIPLEQDQECRLVERARRAI